MSLRVAAQSMGEIEDVREGLQWNIVVSECAGHDYDRGIR
jgi:hypothetical protein